MASASGAAMGFKDHKAAVCHENSSELDRDLRKFPCQVRFAPENHRNAVDYQNSKKAGVFAVEKMTMIQSMAVAFNMHNERTGRLAVRRTENSKLIPWEQGRSRKDRRVACSLVDKVLSVDVVRFR